MLVERIPAWVTATNAYLVVGDQDEALLVDAPPEPDVIGRHIAERGVAVTAVLLTHGHVDHTGGAGKITVNSGAIAYVHPDDDFLTLHPTDQLERIFGYIPPGAYELPERIERLEHGQHLELAGISLEVRHTPGHTPGHCCLYWEDEGILFSGDQLFAGSIGRTDLPGGSYDELMTSMREQVMTLDDKVRVLPGHGPETTIGRERARNPFRDEWAR
ncbi:MAG TPA: MBL fold metallo-hydrolase [Acidimicrobiia bacterium]|nr:MBL fold metallo-hydrolase [Acidimicrobiia bacterium]